MESVKPKLEDPVSISAGAWAYDPVDKLYRFTSTRREWAIMAIATWDDKTRTMTIEFKDSDDNEGRSVHRFIKDGHAEWSAVLENDEGEFLAEQTRVSVDAANAEVDRPADLAKDDLLERLNRRVGLAVEYAWRHMADYSAVLFVTADSVQQLQENLAGLCRVLSLPEQDLTDEAGQARAAVDHLATTLRNWLLIPDNVDTEPVAQAVEDLLAGRGHVLITSRQRTWSAGIESVPLDTLSPDDAVDFLLAHTAGKRQPTDDDQAYAWELAGLLGGLALGLEQAAAFIGRRGLSIPAYVKRWEAQDRRTREWHSQREMHYPLPLAFTWETTLDELNSTAIAILNVFAWLAPDPIPPLLCDTNRLVGNLANAPSNAEMSAGTTVTAADIKAALDQLVDYSMLGRELTANSPHPSLVVHRLVQDITRFRSPEATRTEWITTALQLVESAHPGEPNDVRTWPDWDRT